MVASKVILAVAVVFVSVDLIQGRPGADTEWATPFLDQLNSMTSNISKMVGIENTAEYTEAAKKNLASFADGLKAEVATFSKSFEGKSSVSDMFKESTKNFQTVVDSYVKNLPKDMTLKDFTEKAEQALKTMVEHGTEISKKAQGNAEIEKQIKEFIKKNMDTLMETTKSVQEKISGSKKA